MNLYLVQHAQAKPKEEDPDRPLSEKGTADIKKVALYVAANCGINVKKICHSGKLRAAQTAGILAGHLNVLTQEKVEALSPMDDPAVWAEKLRSKDEDMMLVGHLPHMAKLATALLCGDGENPMIQFQMGCILALTREENLWAVQWMIVPDIING